MASIWDLMQRRGTIPSKYDLMRNKQRYGSYFGKPPEEYKPPTIAETQQQYYTGYDEGYTPGPGDYRDAPYSGGDYVPDPSEIIGQFLTTPAGQVDIGRWAAEYGAYIDPYDINKQKFLEKQYIVDRQLLSSRVAPVVDTLVQATGQTGFAESGITGDMMTDYYKKIGLQSQLLDLAEQGDISQLHRNYISNIYNQIAMLAGKGAFSNLQNFLIDDDDAARQFGGRWNPACPEGDENCQEVYAAIQSEAFMNDYYDFMDMGNDFTQRYGGGAGYTQEEGLPAFMEWGLDQMHGSVLDYAASEMELGGMSDAMNYIKELTYYDEMDPTFGQKLADFLQSGVLSFGGPQGQMADMLLGFFGNMGTDVDAFLAEQAAAQDPDQPPVTPEQSPDVVSDQDATVIVDYDFDYAAAAGGPQGWDDLWEQYEGAMDSQYLPPRRVFGNGVEGPLS